MSTWNRFESRLYKASLIENDLSNMSINMFTVVLDVENMLALTFKICSGLVI